MAPLGEDELTSVMDEELPEMGMVINTQTPLPKTHP